MKNAYELKLSQVQTPVNIVSFFWKLIRRNRNSFHRVLDLGAGDGRFAQGGCYAQYEGIEIDPARIQAAKLPTGAKLLKGCAFQHKTSGYDACIGNPPYVRHHDIESPWKENISDWINSSLGIKLNLHGNLYLYFLCLGMIKTNAKGLLAFLIPFEWVSRPSAASIRSYINQKRWNVSIYRFVDRIFDGVLTTASISVIDKDTSDGTWTFHDIGPDLSTSVRKGITGKRYSILPYSPKGAIWTRRGISPGSQKIFTLTEGERIHAGLLRVDVRPCVTTLKHLPRGVRKLTKTVFDTHFVTSGKKCWLIRSADKKLSSRLKTYLDGVSSHSRSNYTCSHQDPWFAYEKAPIPKLLIQSGFMERGPKMVINSIGAQAVGSMYGIHAESGVSMSHLQRYLSKYNFERRIVPHAKTLKKIEVKQLNAVLNRWKRTRRHG